MGQYQSNLGANIYIRTDKPYYLCGETVTGVVYVQAFQPINLSTLYMKIKGKEDIFYQYEETISEPGQPIQREWRDVEDEKTFFRYKLPLYNFQGAATGQFEFPFSFPTSLSMPGTFFLGGVDDHFKRGNYEQRGAYGGNKGHRSGHRMNDNGDYSATIRYMIKVESHGVKGLKHTQELVMRQKMAYGEADLRSNLNASVSTWCCIDQGTSSINSWFQKNYYTPGETAIMMSEIDNTKCKLNVSRVECKLMMNLMLKPHRKRGEMAGNMHEMGKTIHKVVATKDFEGIPSGQKLVGDQCKFLDLPLVGNFPPTTNGKLINCNYNLSITAHLDGCTCCSTIPNSRIPVTIFSPEPPYYNAQQIPQNWAPQVMPMYNCNFSNEYMYKPKDMKYDDEPEFHASNMQMMNENDRLMMMNNNMGMYNPNANMGNPNMGNPNMGMGNPNMGNPNMGMGNPNMGNPNMGNPNMGYPNNMGDPNNMGMGNPNNMDPNGNPNNMGNPNLGMGNPNNMGDPNNPNNMADYNERANMYVENN